MAHIKRHSSEKNWPVSRKGTRFVVAPNAHKESGIPLLLFLREILKVAKTKAEVKKALHAKNILVNEKPAMDERQGLTLFDKITIVPEKKSYQLTLSKNGKFTSEEVSEKEAGFKISKVKNKTLLKGKKVQLNLDDGRNVISSEKCETNDSVVVDLKKKKVEKVLPLKENVSAFVFAGKHAGFAGKIEKINLEQKIAILKDAKKQVNVLIKHLVVTQ
jgi:small subunit ribosomal protein S4e